MFHRLSSCFTAGGKAGGGKTGKSEEKARKSTGLKRRKRAGTQEKASPGQRKNRKDATKPAKEKTVLCRVASELSLAPASLCRSMGQEEDFIWEMCDGVIHWDIKHGKIPPSDFFLSCPMRRRSLRLLSSRPFHNSDGDTGTFFRVENYRREFYVPKTEGLNVEGIVLRLPS